MKDEIKDEVTHFFEKVLDFAEVAIGDKNVYKAYRAKVLRLGNNCIRALHKFYDENCPMVEVPPEYEYTVADSEEEPEYDS